MVVGGIRAQETGQTAGGRIIGLDNQDDEVDDGDDDVDDGDDDDDDDDGDDDDDDDDDGFKTCPSLFQPNTLFLRRKLLLCNDEI